MQYDKPALTIREQAAHLEARGLRGDRARMERRLSSVNYYRLSAYWIPFRRADGTFREGADFEDVWSLYVFDRELRLHVMDAVERVEVAVRARLACSLGHRYGPFGYAEDPLVLWGRNPDKRNELFRYLEEEVKRSKEPFVEHFFQKYGGGHLPIWMAAEVMSFGTMCKSFCGCGRPVQRDVADFFGVPTEVMESWLKTLNVVRNICAHHARLWNRELGFRPKLPYAGQDRDWHDPVRVDNRRVFAVLTILCHCMHRVAAGSRWALRLRALITDNPKLPIDAMGFPNDWTSSPIWRRMLTER